MDERTKQLNKLALSELSTETLQKFVDISEKHGKHYKTIKNESYLLAKEILEERKII